MDGVFRPERCAANVTPGVRRSESFGPVVALFCGARDGLPAGPERDVPGHCLGRACFRWRREGAGWSSGGEAGVEPFPLEGPGEPSACWEREGGLLVDGEILRAAEIPLRRRRCLRCPAPLPQLLEAVISCFVRSYFSWTQESGHPGAPSHLARNAGRKPRTQPTSK